MNQLTICNTTIRQDSEGRYCLNDLHKASGGLAKNQPFHWSNLKSTDGLIRELRDDQTRKSGIAPWSSYHGGANPGTFVVKELVYAYAMWISPKFHLQVIRAYDSLVTGSRPQEPVPEMFPSPCLVAGIAPPRVRSCAFWA